MKMTNGCVTLRAYDLEIPENGKISPQWLGEGGGTAALVMVGAHRWRRWEPGRGKHKAPEELL